MSPDRETQPVKDMRFAADLRRQFEDLASGMSPPCESIMSRAAASAKRHVRVVGAAAAAVIVLGLVLVGLPGGSTVSGPEPVSAAQVIERALHAISSGKTLRADLTGKVQIGVSPDGVPEYAVEHSRLFLRSDGSFRETLTDEPQTSKPPGMRDRDDARDTAYDAVHGVFRDYMRGWDADEGRYVNRLQVTTGFPLGQPDSGGSDVSATTRALQASGQATLETTTYEGRRAWLITGTVKGTPDWVVPGSAEGDETYSLTLDEKTCLPLRFQVLIGGRLVLDNSWTNVRIDEPLPDATFTLAAPKGAEIVHRDAGFRRLPLARIASLTDYAPLLPDAVPAGYQRRWTAFASRWTTKDGPASGRDVVALQYERGFDALTVTTRIAADPRSAATIDPIDDMTLADPVRRDVRLTAGAFSGVTARVVVGPRISTPHLYAVRNGILLTVAGGATAEELVAIAESLQPYRSD